MLERPRWWRRRSKRVGTKKMADIEIIADPPRNATFFDADTSSTRGESVAPGDSGNVTPPAHRSASSGACYVKDRAERRRIECDDGITPELIAFINRKYGLTEAHARQMQLREIPTEESLSLVGVTRKGIFIPYFDRDGNLKPGYFRIRFYAGPPGFQADKKPLRYMGRKGITLGTYLAPFMDWKSFEATQQRGYFVESEFAAAHVHHGSADHWARRLLDVQVESCRAIRPAG
jgi:hypothetical protein